MAIDASPLLWIGIGLSWVILAGVVVSSAEFQAWYASRLHAPVIGNAALLLDSDGKLGKSLNAFPAPRYYLLSGDLRLVEAQIRPGELPTFIRVEESRL